jgi:hypothetical protein
MKWVSASGDPGLLFNINGAVVTSKPGASIVTSLGERIRTFTFLTDSPLHFPSRFANWPPGGTVDLVDSSFRDQAHFIRYDRTSFPHAGPDVQKPTVSCDERDIDILFIGSLGRVLSPNTQAAGLYPDKPRLAALFVNAFENRDPAKTSFQFALETARAMNNG